MRVSGSTAIARRLSAEICLAGRIHMHRHQGGMHRRQVSMHCTESVCIDLKSLGMALVSVLPPIVTVRTAESMAAVGQAYRVRLPRQDSARFQTASVSACTCHRCQPNSPYSNFGHSEKQNGTCGLVFNNSPTRHVHGVGLAPRARCHASPAGAAPLYPILATGPAYHPMDAVWPMLLRRSC